MLYSFFSLFENKGQIRRLRYFSSSSTRPTAIATGATRANVCATVLERWFQGADHPVPAAFGEGLYLKALVARVGAR